MKQAIALALFAAAVLFAAAPFLTPGFGGFDPDQYPVPQVDPPVQPATWAFSIWGVIYLWLIAGTGFGLVRRAQSEEWRGGRNWLLLSLAPGIAWLAVALASPVWATVLIWWMALTAIAALLRAGDRDRWWQRETYGIYAGWLTAAASVSIGLLAAGWGVLGANAAALLTLAIALVIALLVIRCRRDTLAYPAAVIWALAAVAWQNATPVNPAPLALALFGIVAVGLQAWRNRA